MTLTRKLTITVPPKRGPIPQLNIPSKQVKNVIISEKINGRNRQSFTQYSKANTKHPRTGKQFRKIKIVDITKHAGKQMQVTPW